MPASGRVTIELLPTGGIKIVAKDMIGTEAELLEALGALAKEVGGELVVEKHVEGAHHHHHGDGKMHSHGGK
jgi:hypothetical protein